MRALKEVSAGGVVTRDGKVLLTLMRTMNNREVWTYPKGHVEEGETPREAAIREVFEETGYKCEIISPSEIYVSSYNFVRNGFYTEKKVYWYSMKAVSDSQGIQTPEEIVRTDWASYEQAQKLLFYSSDLEILELIKPVLGGN